VLSRGPATPGWQTFRIKSKKELRLVEALAKEVIGEFMTLSKVGESQRRKATGLRLHLVESC
jgi:hypothetical protein